MFQQGYRLCGVNASEIALACALYVGVAAKLCLCEHVRSHIFIPAWHGQVHH